MDQIFDAVLAHPVDAGRARSHHRRDVEAQLRQQRHGDRRLPLGAAERRRRLQVEQARPLVRLGLVALSSRCRAACLGCMLMHRRLKTTLRGAGIALGLGAVVVGVKWTGVDAIHKALVAGRRRTSRGCSSPTRQGPRSPPFRGASCCPTALRPSWGATLDEPIRRLRHQRAAAVLRPRRGVAPALAAARASARPASRRSSSTACCSSRRGRRSSLVAALAATRVPAVPHSYVMAVLISASVIFGRGRARSRSAPRAGGWSAGCAGRSIMFGVPPTAGQGCGNGARPRRGRVDPVDRGLRAC